MGRRAVLQPQEKLSLQDGLQTEGTQPLLAGRQNSEHGQPEPDSLSTAPAGLVQRQERQEEEEEQESGTSGSR